MTAAMGGQGGGGRDGLEPRGGGGTGTGGSSGANTGAVGGAAADAGQAGEPTTAGEGGTAGSAGSPPRRDCSDDAACSPFSTEPECLDCRQPEIAVGAERSCLLEWDGAVRCWGANISFGVSDIVRVGGLVPPEGEFQSLALSNEASCALGLTGKIQCWGVWYDSYDGFSVTPPSGAFVALAAPALGVCGLQASGDIVCTDGAHEGPFRSVSAYGALSVDGDALWWGEETTTGPFSKIAAGIGHVCAIRTNASLQCWGYDEHGQASPPSGEFEDITVGERHSCGIRADGALSCWGAANLIEAPSGTYARVAAGATHTCALGFDGKVACWGAPGFELHPPWDLAAEPDVFTKISVAGEARYATELGYWAPGHPGGCGIEPSGTLKCFAAAAGEPDGQFVQVSAGQDYACAIRMDGALVCWGDITITPEEPPLQTYSHVSAGLGSVCAVRTSGELECWNGGRFDVSPPGPPPAGVFTQVALQSSFEDDEERVQVWGCALAVSGDAHCWRGGSWMVTGPFVQVATGIAGRACGLAADGSVTCWTGSDDVTVVSGSCSKIGMQRRDLRCLSTDGTIEGLPGDVFTDMSVGGDFTCGLLESGHIRCSGSRVR
jgi:hypothetical protein